MSTAIRFLATAAMIFPLAAFGAPFKSGTPFRYSCTGTIKNFGGKYVLMLDNPKPLSKYGLICQASVIADQKHPYIEEAVGATAVLMDAMKGCKINERCRISGVIRGPFNGLFYWVKIDSASPE